MINFTHINKEKMYEEMCLVEMHMPLFRIWKS
jgi:hypothetical protein